MSERVFQPESKVTDYFLGEWRLCVRSNSLRRGDTRVELENRLVLLLIFFIENKGDILDKERILKTIWHGKVVNDDSLAVAISHLRKALGDNSRAPEYINTIPGTGYQLIAKAGIHSTAYNPTQPANHHTPICSTTVSATTPPGLSLVKISLILLFLVLATVSGYLFLQTSKPVAISTEAERVEIKLNTEQQQRWDEAQQQIAIWTPESFKSAI